MSWASLLRVFVADFVGSAATASPIAQLLKGTKNNSSRSCLSFPTLTAPPTTYQNYQKWLLGYVILISTCMRCSSILRGKIGKSLLHYVNSTANPIDLKKNEKKVFDFTIFYILSRPIFSAFSKKKLEKKFYILFAIFFFFCDRSHQYEE